MIIYSLIHINYKSDRFSYYIRAKQIESNDEKYGNWFEPELNVRN